MRGQKKGPIPYLGWGYIYEAHCGVKDTHSLGAFAISKGREGYGKYGN